MNLTPLAPNQPGQPERAARSRFAPTTLALLSFVLLPVLAFGAARRENVDKSVPAGPIREVRIQNINGDVMVSSGTGDTIEIHAEKTARGSNADELLSQLQVSIRTTGARLDIETIHPKRKKFLGLFDVGTGDNCSVRYAIRMPADRSLRVETVNGGVDVSGIEGKLQAETVNGSIALSGIKGEVDAETVNGSVSLLRAGGAAPTRLETVNGNVELALEKDSRFAFNFETVNGRIDSDFPVTVEGKWGPKSAHGTVGSGTVSIAAESVNGSIKIRSK